MKKIKTLFAFLMIFTMVLGLAACGNTNSNGTSSAQTSEAQNTSEETVTTAEKESDDNSAATEETSDTAAGADSTDDHASAENTSAEDTTAHSDVLVAYFSATGTTKGVAERIAAVTGGDLYEILAADPYTADDLNYNDRSSRSTSEQNDKNARPEIGSVDLSLEGYTTIYLGFPIWGGRGTAYPGYVCGEIQL